jgi:hypothetical protein
MNKKTLTIMAGVIIPVTVFILGMFFKLSNEVASAQVEIRNLRESIQFIHKSINRIEDKLDRINLYVSRDHTISETSECYGDSAPPSVLSRRSRAPPSY